jgi:hypothetical protein
MVSLEAASSTSIPVLSSACATWELLDDGEARRMWDAELVKAEDYAVFQSYGWGEFKRSAGFRPLRWIARDAAGNTVAMVQFLLKSLPLGFAVAWAAGGPAVRFKPAGVRSGFDLAGLLSAVRAHVPRVLVKFDSYIADDPDAAAQFSQLCKRPRAHITSGVSIQFDISKGAKAFVERMTSKHRYYLRKAEPAQLSWEAGNGTKDIAVLVSLHRAMTTSKGLKSGSKTKSEYASLRDALGASGMTIVTGYLDGEPVTSCLTLDFGKKAFYYVAATGQTGRQIGAAYAMLPRLVEVLHGKGIELFDFGGIAPGSPKAKGVDHFKKGFGGTVIEYLGEWEWASVPFLASAVGILMKYRGMAA